MKATGIRIILFFTTIITLHSQTPKLQWVKQIGGIYDDNATSISVDNHGNTYIAGNFTGTTDFDPGSGIYNLDATHGNQAYISELDKEGRFLWAIPIVGTDFTYANAIAMDGLNNVYVTGYFTGTTDFDPSIRSYNLTNENSSNVSIFIAKYTNAGNLLWAKSIEGNKNGTMPNSLTVDRFGNACVVGNFQGIVDFDPSDNVFNLTRFDGPDIFVLKLATDGTFIWVKQFMSTGNPSKNSGNSIAVDTLGNIYTSGVYNSTTDFDPGTKQYTLTFNGSASSFISKLDIEGNFVSVMGFHGLNFYKGKTLAVDESGNMYATGGFGGPAEFDPGPDTVILNTSGLEDVFVVKIDSAGKFNWAKRMGGSQTDYATSIAIDRWGNVFTTGLFTGIADFDPGPRIYTLTSTITTNVFISKLSTKGNFLWAAQLGESNISSIAFDPSGSIHIAGTIFGVGDFDPGKGILYLASEGTSDIFVEEIQEVYVDTKEPVPGSPLSVYPNPTSHSLSVNFGKEILNGRIKLINLYGQTMFEQSNINGSSFTIDIADQPNGMYCIELNEGGIVQRVKVVKE